MIDTRYNVEEVAEALRSAAPTLDPAEQHLALELYRAPAGSFGRDVVESFCHFVHFFASNDTAQRRVADHPGTFVLSVDEAFDVATRSWPALFRDALSSTPRAVDGVAGGDR